MTEGPSRFSSPYGWPPVRDILAGLPRSCRPAHGHHRGRSVERGEKVVKPGAGGATLRASTIIRWSRGGSRGEKRGQVVAEARSGESTIRRLFEAMEHRDEAALTALVTDDFTMTWPQSGERFRGRENALGALSIQDDVPTPTWRAPDRGRR